MAFSIVCSNKGCHQLQEPSLDVDTNEVICSACLKPIINVSDFTKRTMKSTGQVKKKVKQAHYFKCDACGKENIPILVDDDICCPVCNKKITNISKFFEPILKSIIKGKSIE